MKTRSKSRPRRSFLRSAVSPFLVLAALLFGCGTSAPPANEVDRRAALEAMFAEVRARYSEVPVIDRAAVEALGARAVLVDVRPDQERAISTLPGAITAEEFTNLPADPERVVVAYCTIGERSGRFARDLVGDGVDARNLSGGILGWTFDGGELIDPTGKPTKRAHVYGPRWNLLPEGWVGVTGDESP